MPSKVVEVAIGVLAEHRGGAWRVLITRRPEGAIRAGWWEWPGGKVEAGETPAHCLVREFEEELALLVAVGAGLSIVEHRYEHAHVRLHPFFCSRVRRAGESASAELPEPQNRAVAEHRWVRPDELAGYRFLEANAPIVAQVVERLRSEASDEQPEPPRG